MLERIGDAWKGFWARVSPPPAARPKLTFRTEKPDEAPAPRARRAPAGPVPEEGLLIGAGSFRIDLEKALETLERFQLPSPEDFLLPWLRCAVAGKAKRISVKSNGGALEMSFDGEPLTPAQVQDPLASLAAEEDAGRGRHLAYGLLGVLRLDPMGALIESGRGKDRIRLCAGEIWTADTGPETCLRVSWGDLRPELPSRAMDALRRAAGFHGSTLRVGGRTVPVLPPFEGKPRLVRPDAATVLCPAPPGAAASRITLYVLGARAAVIERVLDAPAQIDAYVRDDRLSLNLSQSGVVEGPALKELLGDLAGEVRALVEKALRDWKTPGQAEWLQGIVRHAVAENGGIRGPGVDPFTNLLWEAEVFKTRRGDRLSLRRVSELVKVWGYDIVLGSDETFPAFHAAEESLEFLRGVFRS